MIELCQSADIIPIPRAGPGRRQNRLKNSSRVRLDDAYSLAVQGCPFCEIASGRVDADLIAFQTPQVFVLPALNQRPLNRGHMLVIPVTHVDRLNDVEPALLQQLYTVAGRVSLAVRAAFGATGSTMFQNEGAPDQTVPHVHIHVVPRTAGDDFRIPDPRAERLSPQERYRQSLALREALG